MGTGSRPPSPAPKTGSFASDRLDSWKEIAHYLNRDVRTVQRWEESGGLPVYRHAHGRLKGSAVYAYKSEVDAWLRRMPPDWNGNETRLIPEALPRERCRWLVWVVVPLLALAASVGVWRFARSGPSAAALQAVQRTTYLGLSYCPTFSSHDDYVAFSWNGKNQDNFDVYSKLLDSDGGPLRLTTDPDVDGWPAWSPDGKTIAFIRWSLTTGVAEIRTVPALGGDERKIADGQIPTQTGSETDYFPLICWTPDGKSIIRPDTSVPNSPVRLVLTNVATRRNRPLLTPVAGSAGDRNPTITRDGSRLAFLRSTKGRTYNVYYLPLGPAPDYEPRGEPIQLTDEPLDAKNPVWTHDGREVIYVTVRDGVRVLCRVSCDKPLQPKEIQLNASIGSTWAISNDGRKLAFSSAVFDGDIWKVDLTGGEGIRRILSTSAHDFAPELAPDQRQIAIGSNRNKGKLGIFVFPSESAAGWITLDAPIGEEACHPRWSEDSTRIACRCQNQGNDDICTVPAGGGEVHWVTNNSARDISPSWSHDGEWIYFSSNRSGSYQVWKAGANGTEADAVMLTKNGGLHPVESWDGKVVYYARKSFHSTVWQVPSGGGEEKQVGDFQVFGYDAQNFAAAREGIYYTSTEDPERGFDLWLYEFATGKSKPIRRKIPKRHKGGLSVSRDGRWLLFGAEDALAGDLYLVENFR